MKIILVFVLTYNSSVCLNLDVVVWNPYFGSWLSISLNTHQISITYLLRYLFI